MGEEWLKTPQCPGRPNGVNRVLGAQRDEMGRGIKAFLGEQWLICEDLLRGHHVLQPKANGNN